MQSHRTWCSHVLSFTRILSFCIEMEISHVYTHVDLAEIPVEWGTVPIMIVVFGKIAFRNVKRRMLRKLVHVR